MEEQENIPDLNLLCRTVCTQQLIVTLSKNKSSSSDKRLRRLEDYGGVLFVLSTGL